MSFLAEIIVSQGLVEIEELNEKIQAIQKFMLKLKEEVAATMEEKYLNYVYTHEESFRLQGTLNRFSSEIDEVKDRIDAQIRNELCNSKYQLEAFNKALQEALFSYNLVNELVKIDSALEAANKQNVNENLLVVAKQLKDAEDYLCGPTLGVGYLDTFEAMKFELRKQQEFHCTRVTELWDQSVRWDEISVDSQTKVVRFTIDPSVNKEEVFQTLQYCHELHVKMETFSDKLFRNILCSIISNITVVDCEVSSLLSLRIHLNDKKPKSVDVLNNLTIVFNFLNLQLNLSADDNVSLFSELKRNISVEFCKYLTTNCLSLTVPMKRDELEAYKAFVEDITAFELLVKDIGFLDENDNTLAVYSNNVEELFTAKMCESYLGSARSIMKKDLHDTKQVGPVDNSAPTDLEITVQLSELSPYTFQFPSCQISKSTEELLDLVNEILREVSQNTESCALRLFYTARNIFTMYCEFVPEFHSRLLTTIPQQSAILHNNAMYLAHQVMFLAPQHQDKIKACLPERTVTFVDLVDPLRGLASDVFLKHLQAQKKQMIDNLRDSGLVTLTDSPKFPGGIEKAIRQCLRQLALLQTVWQPVLPLNNYCKALGILCNAFVEELIQKVLAAEDIPADTATSLVAVFSLVVQKAPQVFPEPLEIHRHVKKWAKFCELQLVLGASLRDVDDRWADGKGPLAQEFSPDQVRHLVRALFQISDRRAVLLAKIV